MDTSLWLLLHGAEEPVRRRCTAPGRLRPIESLTSPNFQCLVLYGPLDDLGIPEETHTQFHVSLEIPTGSVAVVRFILTTSRF